ncbi:MAG: hypothetical protein AAB686_00375 [Patescibacteria group bacterium]
MVEIFSQSPFVRNSQVPEEKLALGDAPAVPPPPPSSLEVIIRTMESDVAEMGKTGRLTRTPTLIAATPPSPEKRSLFWIWFLTGVLGTAVLFFGGYFLLPFVLNIIEQTPPVAPPTAPPTVLVPAPTSTTPVFLGHQSFFRQMADDVININPGVTSEPRTTDQQIKLQLPNININSKLIEVVIYTAEGQALAWTDFLRAKGFTVPDADFWRGRLEQDFTYFMERDATGAFASGYVLKLQAGQSPLIIQPSLLQMEKDTALANLFLNPPGESSGDFADAQISGQPVRVKNFKNKNAALVYGFAFNKYLIIATSQSGYRLALSRL